MKHIHSVNGFTGCYTGVIPKICANTIGMFAYEKAAKSIKFKKDIPEDDDEDELEEADRYRV